MTLSDLSSTQARRELSGRGVSLQVGPFVVRVATPIPGLQEYLRTHYGLFPLVEEPGAHIVIRVHNPSLVRRWVKPQAWVSVNGLHPFTRVPVRLAVGVFEWGFNWSVGTQAHQWLVVHSAVVEKHGRAVLLPAAPGSGKSTLCAALAFSGWRLLSDEFALVDPATGLLAALPRPISLKGASIGIMARRIRDARLGPVLADTDGAEARHFAPPPAAVAAQTSRARAGWIVVPKWEPEAQLRLEPTPRGWMLAHLADSSFNYNLLGGAGFARLADLVDESECFKLVYSNLDEAVAMFDRLSSRFDGGLREAR